MTDPAALVVALAHATAREVQAATGRVDTCILSTRVFIEACKYHGIPASPLSVRVMACNAVTWSSLAAGLPPHEWPEDAWSVGFDDRHPDALVQREGRWPGHLVAVVSPLGSPRLLVDASAAQFDRPAHALTVGPVVIAEFPGGWTDDAPLLLGREDGQGMIYGPVGQVLSTGFRQSPDWSRSPADIVGRVIRTTA